MPQAGTGIPPFAPMPPQMRRKAPRTWRERMMRRFGMDTAEQVTKGARTIPNWLTERSMVFFFVSMFACWLLFGYVPEFSLWVVSSISVVLFFYGGKSMAESWERKSESAFLKNVFVVGFVVRIIWAFYGYFFFNMDHYGAVYGERADTTWYMPYGAAIADWIRDGFPIPFSELRKTWGSAIDDAGYPFWLAIINLLTFGESDVVVPFLLKCLLGAYCAISIYNVALRHFGEGTARLAAIFVCLNPNMIYWCGSMFKEAEMVFLCCVAIDNFDRVLSSGKKFTFRSLLPGALAGLALMFFRTALGLVVFLAVFAHIVMASNRVLSTGKKVLAGVLVGAVLMVAMGDRIRTQSQELLNRAQSDRQRINMEWRANRKHGNSFAKYAGAAVFAPLIFTIPFPTYNSALDTQYLQMQLGGGSYIKNIFSFFVIIVMILMLISGEWRRHVFILAYTMGYLVVLVMSEFAQSGRFHMPVWPMLMLFAAYGIQMAKTNGKLKRWFPIVLVLEVFICLAWNWFKLKGRGMI